MLAQITKEVDNKTKMTNRLQLIFFLALFVCMVLVGVITSSVSVIAHSGRTDANGGHNCYVGSCAGTYHYHNGGGYTAPSAPNYVEQGMTNGKAHAEREAENIRSRTRTSGYQTGYSAGLSGTTKSYFVTHPDSICEINFTFDAGTNETYKSWYKSGWLNGCNTIARAVYQSSYEEGYSAGVAAKPAPAKQASISEDSSSNSSGDEWLGWAVLGGFIGLPILGGLWSGIKERWDK